MQNLSIVIITFNEEKNIGRCLESVKDVADDIVVLDSFSTDRTEAICRSYSKVQFIQRAWEGYSASKNFANEQAKYDWILSLDADEALNDELISILQDLKRTDSLHTYSFNRLTNYCGTWIKHSGWYPDKKLRLFNRSKSKWEGTIHEELSVPAGEQVKHINQDILHYSYYTLDDHLKQIEKFTDIASKDLYARGKKPAAYKLWLNTIAKFISYYFLHLGFLDGAAGFSIARYSAWATWLKYRKTRDLFKHAN
ncbi:MAG: glycosyltransferase family 2 protein [Bacteroidetes bacterium]|jgi:glycosyltransferase involved in cell wall biosynthesis|nr:glycosyltransferase family 2 protein [Bacteroidota bacterium]